MLTDAEIRGRLLKVIHERRHRNSGWVPVSEIDLSPEVVERQAVAGVCQQLADVGLIRWQPFAQGAPIGAVGNAQITGRGVAVVETGSSEDLNIRLRELEAGGAGAPTLPVLASSETSQLLCKKALNQAIRVKVWQLFEQGTYDLAVFEAMKAVEVAVREACGYSNKEIGTALVRKAFDPDDGPLADKTVEKAEREARSNLFAGAIGAYRDCQEFRVRACIVGSKEEPYVTTERTYHPGCDFGPAVGRGGCQIGV